MLISLYDAVYTADGSLTTYGTYWRFCVGPDVLGTADTGAAWDDPSALKPKGLFDADARRIIPLDWTAWLESIESTYSSHELLPAAELDAVTAAVVEGTIVMMVSRKADAVLKPRKDYTVTCRITASNGERQDKTLYLRIENF